MTMRQHIPDYSKKYVLPLLGYHGLHLVSQMILVSSPSKPFTYTAKGGARRQAVIADYEDGIDALYLAVVGTEQGISAPVNWTQSDSLDFVRKMVVGVLKNPVDDEADLFLYGCDRCDLVLNSNKWYIETSY
jgi:hypothetical protein